MKKIIIIICSFFILASCTKKQSTEELVLGVMPSMDYLPLAVAEREGYFKELGVNFHIVKFYSANDRDAAFQSGNIDGTVIDYTGAVLQGAGGIGLRLTSRCDAPFYIVAAADSTKDTAGMKGMQVAVSQNTVIDYCVDMALLSEGLTAADIEKVEINKIPLRFEMLMNGKIDATGLPDPLASKAIAAGAQLLTTNQSLGFAITGIMFTEKSLQDKAAQIRLMYKAYNLGVDYMNKSTVADIADILIEEMGFSEDILPAEMPVYTKAEAPTDADIRATSAWLAGRGLVDASYDATTLIERTMLP